MTTTLRGNIALLAERRAAEEADAGLGAKVAAAITLFTGSMAFVVIHAVVYGAWVLVNLGAIPGLPRFDPSFVILATEASVEAIFLSTFVLISQNRMAATAQRRADLDLHINLLAEDELSRLASLVGRIAAKLDVTVDEADLDEITHKIEPDKVLDALDKVEP